MARIALVAPFGLRAKGTTRARVLPLAQALARRGHEVALFIPPYDCPEDSGRAWWQPAGDASLPQVAQNDIDQGGVGIEDSGRAGWESAGDSSLPPVAQNDIGGRGVWVVNVRLPRWGQGAAGWHAWIAWRLLVAVRAWRPEVVHIFKPKGPSGLVGAALWFSYHRVTLSPHRRVAPRLILDSDDWEGPGGWNDDPRAGYSPLQRRFFTWQERFGFAHADAWTVAGECLRQRALAFGADPGQVFTMPNGVALAPQAPAASPAVGSSVLLYTRFAGVRPADVTAIWERVRRACPEARLQVVGRGLAGEEAQIAGLPGVTALGWIEPAARPALFAQTGIAVVPWADTPANRARSSVKVRELMAAGLAIVAYAVGELPDVIGDAGLLAPPGNADAFAGAVVALLRDPARAAHLGQAARRRAETACHWDDMCRIALRAYGLE